MTNNHNIYQRHDYILNMSRPFRITDAQRKETKGICAATLDGVVKKSMYTPIIYHFIYFKIQLFLPFLARKHFEIGTDAITIVLEEDGTELVDDEYLQTLDPNTKLMVLKAGETWHQQFSFVDETDRSGGGSAIPDPVNVVKMLVKNPASIALLSEEELEVVVEAEDLNASQFWDLSSADLAFLQNACADQLDTKQQLKNALDFIGIVEKATKQTEK